MLKPGGKYKVLHGQTYRHEGFDIRWISAETDDIVEAVEDSKILCLNSNRSEVIIQTISVESFQKATLEEVPQDTPTTASLLGITC